MQVMICQEESIKDLLLEFASRGKRSQKFSWQTVDQT
jgi:hypothetical protein